MKEENKASVYREEYLVINGAAHYLLHYPGKPEEPLFLFIHGGPGVSESSLAYLVESYEERNYNIVYYDQRGAGKTLLKNPHSCPAVSDLEADLLKIVLYLKEEYHKEKIAVLGHSFGSALAALFALKHPEHVLCFVGSGQAVDICENEAYGYLECKEAIQNAGSKKDARKLAKLGIYPDIQSLAQFMKKMRKLRGLQQKYGLTFQTGSSPVPAILKSPIFRLRDLPPLLFGQAKNRTIMEELLRFDLRDYGTDYRMPVYFLLGRQDRQTPLAPVQKYFDLLTAPEKKMYLIENAGHMAMLDNTRDYRKAVCEIAERVRP